MISIIWNIGLGIRHLIEIFELKPRFHIALEYLAFPNLTFFIINKSRKE